MKLGFLALYVDAELARYHAQQLNARWLSAWPENLRASIGEMKWQKHLAMMALW